MSDDPARSSDASGRFGTLEGVFVPTTLTILGVILFLRTGWVVGETGLLGAWAIITVAFLISTATALSLSSIVTNMKVGAGGAFSVISQTLGIEIGGSIGAPLYLSQALAAAMYIFGFREGWRWIFPEHPAWAVDLVAFGVIFAIAFISARLAFRLQYVILAVIGASLVSLLAALWPDGFTAEVTWWRLPPPGEGLLTSDALWVPFAVFFPAVTGIMAGTNMSGELKSPARSIPVGTLAAIGVTYVVYIGVAAVLAGLAPVEELAEDKRLMIDLARWSPLVLAGLLAATFSSALSTIVGAPRIIQALSSQRVVPEWIGAQPDGGEPRRALLVTGAIVLAGIAMRDLNAIAELLTLFFLLTYATLNLVLLAEMALGAASFRPRFRVPWAVPLVGLVGCVAAMFVVSPLFTIVAIVAIGVIYGVLLRRDLEGPHGEVRSGLAIAVADWAVRALSQVPASQRRTWQANLLVPVQKAEEARRFRSVIAAVAHPTGSVVLLGLGEPGSDEADKLAPGLENVAETLDGDGVLTRSAVVESADSMQALRATLEVLQGSFVRPNVLFLPIRRQAEDEGDDTTGIFPGLAGGERFEEILERAQALDFSLCLFTTNDFQSWEPQYDRVEVWFTDLDTSGDLQPLGSGIGLVLLTAWKLAQRWDVKVHFKASVISRGGDEEPDTTEVPDDADDPDDDEADDERVDVDEDGDEGGAPSPEAWPHPLSTKRERVEGALRKLHAAARIPNSTWAVHEGSIADRMAQAPEGTLIVVGSARVPTLAQVREVIRCTDRDLCFVCRSSYVD